MFKMENEERKWINFPILTCVSQQEKDVEINYQILQDSRFEKERRLSLALHCTMSLDAFCTFLIFPLVIFSLLKSKSIANICIKENKIVFHTILINAMIYHIHADSRRHTVGPSRTNTTLFA